MTESSDLTNMCEVCGIEKSEIVACVPGFPYSAAYCKECSEADAHPWFIMVALMWGCGSYDNMKEESRMLIKNTLKRLGKTEDDLTIAVDAMEQRYKEAESQTTSVWQPTQQDSMELLH